MIDALHERGYACVPAPGMLAHAERDPWALARTLLGEAVTLVEAHPIRPLPEGRSFASNQAATPLHTDSQSRRGVPPYLQVMLCERPAERGGETILLDTWALLERIAAAEPELFHALLTRPRRIPFVFGDVVGPTLALRGDALVFTHSPMPVHDEVGRRLAPWLAAAPLIELRVAAGEVLLVDNHRMLHGRRGFADPRRRFVRLLIWTATHPPAPAHLLEPAAAVHDQLAELTRPMPAALRESLLGPDASEPLDPRLAIVLELLRGASPGVLARRHSIPEPELYRWRDAVLRSADEALARLSDPESHQLELDRARARLERELR